MADQALRRFAAIDIGTVTCRMLVADVISGRVVPVAREYEITNLGEGVDATGVLSEAAMRRVTAAIDRYLAVRDALDAPEHPVLRTVCVATSAARDAKNADEFARMLAERGLALAVIPGEQEAALSFRGASADFADFGGRSSCSCGGSAGSAGRDERSERAAFRSADSDSAESGRIMVVDVGGGSTEVVAGCAGQMPEAVHSFNIGCRRMTERFLKSDPPAACEIEQARAWCARELEAYFSQVSAVRAVDRMVAVAGTATTAVSIRDAMEVYDSARVHGSVVSLAELEAVTQRLASLPVRQREQVVGLDPRRAPVITAGMIILEEVMRAAGVREFTASESDILQGMILEAAEGNSIL